MSQDLRIEIQYEFVDVNGKTKDIKTPVLEPNLIQKNFEIQKLQTGFLTIQNVKIQDKMEIFIRLKQLISLNNHLF